MKHFAFATPLLLLLVLGFKGCGSTKPPTANQSGPAPQGSQTMDFAGLVDSLRANGAKVEPTGNVTQPFFSVAGKTLRVNGADVQVFEYRDAPTAEAEASLVSRDGSEVRRSKIGWVGPPHFYKKGKLIAVYIGDDAAALKALDSVLGRQFAGK